MQSKDEIEKSYENPDPWGYQASAQDENRKKIIIEIAELFCPFKYKIYPKVIDICCGEGWITGSLPGDNIDGIELSDNAAARLPDHVNRVTDTSNLRFYDLVVATGCLYPHYDTADIVHWINRCCKPGTIILISNIEAWEHTAWVNSIIGTQIFEARFPYNEHFQRMRVFRV